MDGFPLGLGLIGENRPTEFSYTLGWLYSIIILANECTLISPLRISATAPT